ncbi:MAG: META domain-containing protein [Ignavibacteria bacterium]|nr:META domain-containing protein [Ignavibacteria bacterium]
MSSKDTSDFKFKLYSEGVDFYATGNEPFWNLSIAVNQFLRFNSLNGISVKLGSVQSEKAMDANVVRYTASTTGGFFTATISQNVCIDNMSGDTSSYRVIVELNNPGDENYKKFEGCGNYIPNYALSRKWILKQLGDADISISDIKNRIPELEINLENMRFAGNAGCNRVAGGLFLEYNLIRFSNPVSTMMMCENMELEQKFLDAISKVTYFKILGNQLLLANPDTVLMVLYDPETVPKERASFEDDTVRVYRLNDVWVLETLNGKSVEAKNTKNKIPQLEISVTELRYNGNGGCNNIFGNFTVDGRSISFGPAAATRMMCPDSIEPEFLSALKEINTWDIRNNRLYLMKDGTETAVFKKVD